MDFRLEVIIRLMIAMFIGGLIGLERERSNRPAGFRTHTLVCVGAALIFLTSEFAVNKYSGVTNIDPTRLPAQIISGIGFLGAGAIIHYRSHIKGLTSAATLWVVACLGLAIGAGFYWGAVAATAIVYITLIFLKNLEKSIFETIASVKIGIEVEKFPEHLQQITELMDILDVEIKNIATDHEADQDLLQIIFLLHLPSNVGKLALLKELSQIEGILINWAD